MTRTRVAVGHAEARGVGRTDAQRAGGVALAPRGSRKIVFAVNDRRSPADSTNG